MAARFRARHLLQMRSRIFCFRSQANRGAVRVMRGRGVSSSCLAGKGGPPSYWRVHYEEARLVAARRLGTLYTRTCQKHTP